MINDIKNSSEYGHFTIHHDDRKLGCFTEEDSSLKINDNGNSGSQKGISNFSKHQLKDLALIILESYIYSHKKMKEMIEQEVSEKVLSDQKRLILLIRDVLETLTSYISDYHKIVLDPYKKL